MQINKLHEWDLGIAQAKAVQKNLRAWVSTEDQFTTVKTIARVKVKSINNEPLVKATAILLSYPDLKVIEKKSASLVPSFPITKEFSSFRNCQVVIEALRQLQRNVDLIICDGQGVIDEESFGLATHIGLLTHKPTIGLRKPPKEHTLAGSVVNSRGAWLPVTSLSGSLVIGGIVRVGVDLPPIQVSPGHAICFNSAVKFALDCFPKEINKPNSSEAIDINHRKKKASA